MNVSFFTAKCGRESRLRKFSFTTKQKKGFVFPIFGKRKEEREREREEERRDDTITDKRREGKREKEK